MHEVLGGCESACRYHARPRLRWPALASLLFHGLHRSSGVKGRLKTDSQESSWPGGAKTIGIIFEAHAYISYNLKFVY